MLLTCRRLIDASAFNLEAHLLDARVLDRVPYLDDPLVPGLPVAFEDDDGGPACGLLFLPVGLQIDHKFRQRCVLVRAVGDLTAGDGAIGCYREPAGIGNIDRLRRIPLGQRHLEDLGAGVPARAHPRAGEQVLRR